MTNSVHNDLQRHPEISIVHVSSVVFVPGAGVECLSKVQFDDFSPYAWRAFARIRSTTIARNLSILAMVRLTLQSVMLLGADKDDCGKGQTMLFINNSQMR